MKFAMKALRTALYFLTTTAMQGGTHYDPAAFAGTMDACIFMCDLHE